MFENIYCEFISLMDAIFYEGYSEELAKYYPEEFTREYNLYLDNYTINKKKKN